MEQKCRRSTNREKKIIILENEILRTIYGPMTKNNQATRN